MMAAFKKERLMNGELRIFGTSHMKILRHFHPRTSLHLTAFSVQGWCAFMRYRTLIVFLSLWIALLYITYFLQIVYTHTEVIPFQKDLELNTRSVYIEGELEAYGKTQSSLNYTVDCNAFTRKHTKEDDFVYVAVLTSKKTVGRLGKAVYDTWGQEPDKIDFYVGNAALEDCDCDKCKEMPIVRLDVVRDDEYPPQQKAFAMLEHICQHHIDDYKWFVRADDDGFFKFSNLRHLLHSLDENVPLIFGYPNPGYWHGLFYLNVYGRKYCDGSAVIYSRAALKGMCPHLRECSEQCITHHEDVEVGRCAMNHLGLQCAQSTGELKLSELFYHTSLRDRTSFTGELENLSYVKKAIHMHKVSDPTTMHNLHAYYLHSQKIMQEKCSKTAPASAENNQLVKSN